MKITIDVSDREMLDIDYAISERKQSLSKKLSWTAYREPNKYDTVLIEELESLSSVLDKLYEALNKERSISV